MKTTQLGSSPLQVPVIGLGCMRINELEKEAVPAYLERCLELGVNFFDHADIYSGGECESRFAEGFRQLGFPREDIILQSKCGIVPGWMYDLSYDYIIKAVDGILTRLDTEYLDVLLLHRPDSLFEPEEVARAFDDLSAAGKVRHFGVSNFRPYQIRLLKSCVKQDICVDQLQFSISFSSMISAGLEANMMTDGAANRDGSVLDYCRLHDITVQAWSPFQGRHGAFIDSNEAYPDLNWALGEIGAKYGVSKTTIAAAWILRHPAKIQTIVGTMNPQRLEDSVKASEITLTREEWYRLYTSAGHMLP